MVMFEDARIAVLDKSRALRLGQMSRGNTRVKRALSCQRDGS